MPVAPQPGIKADSCEAIAVLESVAASGFSNSGLRRDCSVSAQAERLVRIAIARMNRVMDAPDVAGLYMMKQLVDEVPTFAGNYRHSAAIIHSP